jgi:serine/threonine protein phosphatase PrpC
MIYQTKSLLGLRDKNEDEIDIVFNYKGTDEKKKVMNYYAVYDGHGGSSISKYVRDKLSKYFMNISCDVEINKTKTCDKYITTVYNCVQDKIAQLNLASRTCGTTALVVMQYEKAGIFSQLKVVNLGDCRAVLCKSNNLATPLTKDHKPMSPDENERILALGGTITHDRDDDPRINGLSVSKAFGDVEAKPHVSHVPEIFDYELSVKNNQIIDKFLILGCDGIWDVLSCQDAVDYVLFKMRELSSLQTCNGTGRNNIAHLLGKWAIKKGSADNISVAIIFF